MKPQIMLALVLMGMLAMHCKDAEAISFPWSCASLSGVCRQGVCLPSELYFGPLGCGKGFQCCVSHFL
ncbi:beta-defensin-like 1 [Xyrauchen texanus]|uniref:beta-defensin-like 1 n=1 Tax=Xyrauchen texanus TaxID=154827 RepID=UPI00224290F6|nr:beta-defensin-like 1 [Xyrauchen texanus]